MRLSGFINKSSIDDQLKSILRIFVLVLYLSVVLHLFAGIWNYIITVKSVWVPPTDWVFAGDYSNLYTIYKIKQVDNLHYYLMFLYNSVLFLGGNEMGPRNELELISSTLILILMAILNAALFGDMAVEVENSGK